MATRAFEPDDSVVDGSSEEAVSKRVIDLSTGEIADITSLGDVSVVRTERPANGGSATVEGGRGRSYAYTPRRARPPWVKPAVLVLGDDLPNYLRAERSFVPLTESGLHDLLEAPARPQGRRTMAPIVAVPAGSPNGFADLIERLDARGIPVVPLRELVQNRCRLSFLDDDVVAGIERQSWWRRATTRAIDVLLGTIGCVVLTILYPFIAAAIKLEDGGPVFYVQERIGRGGRSFRLYKFRSMRVDAEETGPVWATLNDERVTRVGAFIRRCKLDELPQFVNVLVGDMSVVGPRPERPAFVATLRKMIPHYDVRQVVRPGLTGWGTVRVGYGNSIEAKHLTHQYDLYHLRNRTLRFDIEIMARSLFEIMLRGERQDRFML